jgi:flagellar hook-length control protein FliK
MAAASDLGGELLPQSGMVAPPWLANQPGAVAVSAALTPGIAGVAETGLSGGKKAPALSVSLSGANGQTLAQTEGAQAMAAASDLGGELLPQSGMVAQTALMDAADDVGTGVQEGPTAAGAYRRAGARMPGAAMQSRDGGAHTVSVAGSRPSVKDPKGIEALSAVAVQQHVAERREPSSVWVNPLQRTAQDSVATVVPLSLATAGESPDGRVLARGVEAGSAAGSALPGVWGSGDAGYELQGAALPEISGAFVDPAAAGAEDALAEQVAYWVGQNIQNAELTVDHEGSPVEVSVSLTGNEAHVAFRSDQTQTRELLDASTGQLRELLRNEGLVLTGVTVGGSGGQGARQGEGGAQSGQPGARHAQVVVPAGTAAAARSGASLPTERSVDVFV